MGEEEVHWEARSGFSRSVFPWSIIQASNQNFSQLLAFANISSYSEFHLPPDWFTHCYTNMPRLFHLPSFSLPHVSIPFSVIATDGRSPFLQRWTQAQSPGLRAVPPSSAVTPLIVWTPCATCHPDC